MPPTVYVGENAFGVKRAVSRHVEGAYYIRSADLDAEVQWERSLSFEISRDEAKVSKPWLVVYVVGSIDEAEPPIGDLATHANNLHVKGATVDDPIEEIEYQHTVSVKMRDVWLVDSRDGRVVARAREIEKSSDPIAAAMAAAERSGAAEAATRPGHGVSEPVLVSKVEPEYPEVARKARISGIVIVECTISMQGEVTDVHVLKPLPFGLDQAAVDAVKQWKFRPGTRDGEPVAVTQQLTVNFKLP